MKQMNNRNGSNLRDWELLTVIRPVSLNEPYASLLYSFKLYRQSIGLKTVNVLSSGKCNRKN